MVLFGKITSLPTDTKTTHRFIRQHFLSVLFHYQVLEHKKFTRRRMPPTLARVVNLFFRGAQKRVRETKRSADMHRSNSRAQPAAVEKIPRHLG
jgi:hypothetical protein